MIFAELRYAQHYSEIHAELVDHLAARFPAIEHGLQGDSWIWIFSGDAKVAVDSFSSMKHQVKAKALDHRLAREVIRALSERFALTELAVPEPEPHDEV